MEQKTITINGRELALYTYNTVVVGTGAAGYNAADRLWSCGQTDIAIVSEHRLAGTSRNTGSDKQTYYKLTLAGGEPDSVAAMAETLFAGGCVDGDIALAEAAMSAQSFLRLVELGVPFPTNRYGEFIGYKTDHDPRRRATSVGPLTSKRMTEALEQSVLAKGIPLFDGYQVVAVLTDGERARGLLCLSLNSLDTAPYTVFACRNIVYATGGPAGMYADSVYPNGHYGATGIALEAGVLGRNLTEWQYGLASVSPRWNVSGTYMQALPRFLSTDRDGGDPREFLGDFLPHRGEQLTKVFLKGYQWPFDVRRAAGGSSIIDLLVYIECHVKGRRVFLDFTANPFGAESLDFSLLESEAQTYLERAGADFGTPYQRLLHMNAPAAEFYRDKGVDLAREPLEIALCAQHNNGGLAIDRWWQTNLSGFFAVGEAAGSHGVYRPGGSALNAGQVGSLRAAQYIHAHCTGAPEPLSPACREQIAALLRQSDRAVGDRSTVDSLWEEARQSMSRVGAAIREPGEMRRYRTLVRKRLDSFGSDVKIVFPRELSRYHRLHELLVCQLVYLDAMLHYVDSGGKSRGSALYVDPKGGVDITGLPLPLRFSLEEGGKSAVIQEARYLDGGSRCDFRPVRPLPRDDDFFENVWRSYRENQNID